MVATLRTPAEHELPGVVEALRGWQTEGGPVQLHPGDLGWHWRLGGAATAAAVRVWQRDRRILAVGLLDGPRLLRLAVAPDAASDEDLADRMAADVTDPGRGVLPAGAADVEARFTGPLQPRLAQAGWTDGEHWTPLVRSLAAPVPGHGLRIEVAGPDAMADRTAVQRAAFEGSRFSDDRWRTMAAGPAYREARCLVGYDADGRAVAAVTVWSAGRGRPGLLEPLGVHRDHRGRGHGRAITLAAAGALRELGSSSATVCTPSANTGAVAAYRSGGFEEQPQVADLHRQDQRPSGAAARR